MRKNTILIKNIELNKVKTDILIENNIFTLIQKDIDSPKARIIDGTNKAILPPFYNCHTHAGMTLMRGYADDMELYKWLTEYIWPLESNLTADHCYHGTKLACLEMIKTGSVFFADMYFNHQVVIKAAEEMGLRIATGQVFLDGMKVKKDPSFWENLSNYSELLIPIISPHAIYTVCEENLKWCANFAKEKDIHIHIHAAETKKEVEDCYEAHGCSPIEYLDKCGLLTAKTIIAHAIHLTANDRKLIKDKNCVVVHNPVSNMKLCSGVFDFQKVNDAGIRITLGTDGASSNNNLSMLDEMKTAALLAKQSSGNPEVCSAEETYAMASINGAEAFGINAGVIEKGRLADCILVDLNNSLLTPSHNLISNMVYSADSSCIDSVICNGRVLMENKVIDNEKEIIENAKIAVKDLLGK